MNETKLNVGAGPSWRRDGWATTDHKKGIFKSNSAWSLDYPDACFDLLFSSHMLEHIPHFKIDLVLHEFNRVLKPGGGIRLLCPNLEVIARAYVEKDKALRDSLLAEDPAVRTDLGFGGALANFVISGGSDMLMFSRNGECIGGYAHVAAFDFEMMKTLLERHGFGQVRRCEFLESRYIEFREPLHPVTDAAQWKLESQWGDRSAGITGFDRDPISSLIVEAVKVESLPYRGPLFGTRGHRGLDPVHFSWKNMTIAYFHFTFVKVKQLPHQFGKMLLPALNWILPQKSWRRRAVKNSRIASWLYRNWN
jgi:SAM-dependent methyltransferase